MEDSALSRAETLLRKHFGYDRFRPGQRDAVDAILGGSDVLAVMPTGAGKSLCYQVPALALDGTTIVVSPLISLMGDQVAALVEADVPAAYLNSSLPGVERDRVLEGLRTGTLRLVYVSPERLEDERFLAAVEAARVPFVAVDEAHCVSQWGNDFRPSYREISCFIDRFDERPVVAAFTATATARVSDDIVAMLGLREPRRVATGFDRPNLSFAVKHAPAKAKLTCTLAFIEEHPRESGIVYCSTRKEVEQLHAALVSHGVEATRYHAGLDAVERDRNQAAFINDDALVMVATNAFGMGIDKSNVRYVIHYNMPGSIEAYYQEAGRAGRDGEPSACLLLWNDADIATHRFFIESAREDDRLTEEERAGVQASQRARLQAICSYCMTTDCLRHHILRYFGEEPGTDEGCGNCSNCTEEADLVDATDLAFAVMRCVHEMRGRYGKTTIVDVLRGSKSAKLTEMRLDGLKNYGTVDVPAVRLRSVIELMIAKEYLEASEGTYPVVGYGPRWREMAEPGFALTMKNVVRPKKASEKRKVSTGEAVDGGLFERLRQLRKTIAAEANVPPYVIFSDASLRGMCADMPATDEEFLAVHGVGEKKLASYGKRFLDEIAAWKAEQR